MTRRRRIDWPGAWHHVMHRAAGRRCAFRDDDDRLLFIELTSELPARFDVEVHCFCLMGNHFHLLVRSTTGRLSEAMKWLLAGFTRAVNARRGVDGAIFRGRFHSVSVTEVAHRHVVIPYILANPMDLGWTAPLSDYPWSSLGATIEPRAHPGVAAWLETDMVLALHDRENLIAAVEARRDRVDDPLCRVERSASSGVDGWTRVRAAVEVGRCLGGERASDAALRSAAVLIALDAVAIERPILCSVLGISDSGLRTMIARARQAVVRDPAFARIVTAACEVLRGVPLGV